jgi:uncharacterized protein RhaS with RHS repeats
MDSQSGLYYLQARYYDPSTGQFTSVDPLVELTQSPYSYVVGDPLNETDPSGECGGGLFGLVCTGWNATAGKAVNYVQNHPAQAALIAIGVVMVVGGTILTGGLIDAAVAADAGAEAGELGEIVEAADSVISRPLVIAGLGGGLVAGGGYLIYVDATWSSPSSSLSTGLACT